MPKRDESFQKINNNYALYGYSSAYKGEHNINNSSINSNTSNNNKKVFYSQNYQNIFSTPINDKNKSFVLELEN